MATKSELAGQLESLQGEYDTLLEQYEEITERAEALMKLPLPEPTPVVLPPSAPALPLPSTIKGGKSAQLKVGNQAFGVQLLEVDVDSCIGWVHLRGTAPLVAALLK